MLERYPNNPCGDCGRGLTWIEIAFGRAFDPVCGACLIKRRAAQEPRINLDTLTLEECEEIDRQISGEE